MRDILSASDRRQIDRLMDATQRASLKLDYQARGICSQCGGVHIWERLE